MEKSSVGFDEGVGGVKIRWACHQLPHEELVGREKMSMSPNGVENLCQRVHLKASRETWRARMKDAVLKGQ
jgi:hypothetical protein